MPKPFLEIAGVVKRYGPTVALGGVSLAVAEGELFGLLGPNGAGKTTLLAILAGLSDPDEGSVHLGGHRFGTDRRDLRRLVGIATQDLAVYPELTARENLAFFGRLYGLGGPELSKRVEDMLAAVSLTDRADHRAMTFSGGMKRRLNLAVAVVHGPQLLLLDEPTTGVDPQSRNHIFEQVKVLNAAGVTIIYTSHYMEEVQTLCPRIAILDHGQVRACDTLPNLLRSYDTVARIRMSPVPSELVQRVAALPGVKQARAWSDGVELVAADMAPLLPTVLRACEASSAEVTAIELNQPTLERVFLNLTGRGLRD